MKRQRIPVVSDQSLSVTVLLVQAEAHLAQPRVTLVSLREQHRARSGGHYWRIAVREQLEHEAPHVCAGAANGSSRGNGDELERRLDVAVVFPPIAGRHVVFEHLRYRLPGGRVDHQRRFEDLTVDVIIPALARNDFDEMRRERRAVVRVRRVSARHPHATRHHRLQVFVEIADGLRTAREQPDDRLVLESGRVRHEVRQRDRFREGLRNLQVFEVAVDVGIEVESTGGDLLHHRDPDEHLRHRADAEQRVRSDLLMRDAVCLAVTSRHHYAAVANDRHRRADRPVGGDLRRHHAVDEFLHRHRVVEPRGVGRRFRVRHHRDQQHCHDAPKPASRLDCSVH